MDNADKPAYPIDLNNENGLDLDRHAGLSKREAFAMAAMQGLLTQMDRYDAEGNYVFQGLASDAVKLADELLKHLES